MQRMQAERSQRPTAFLAWRSPNPTPQPRDARMCRTQEAQWMACQGSKSSCRRGCSAAHPQITATGGGARLHDPCQIAVRDEAGHLDDGISLWIQPCSRRAKPHTCSATLQKGDRTGNVHLAYLPFTTTTFVSIQHFFGSHTVVALLPRTPVGGIGHPNTMHVSMWVVLRLLGPLLLLFNILFAAQQVINYCTTPT